MMAFWDWAFGMWLGFDCETLMNEISVLTKEIPDSSLIPSAMWGHSEKTAIYELKSRLSPYTKYVGIFLGLSSLQNCEREVFFV